MPLPAVPPMWARRGLSPAVWPQHREPLLTHTPPGTPTPEPSSRTSQQPREPGQTSRPPVRDSGPWRKAPPDVPLSETPAPSAAPEQRVSLHPPTPPGRGAKAPGVANGTIPSLHSPAARAWSVLRCHPRAAAGPAPTHDAPRPPGSAITAPAPVACRQLLPSGCRAQGWAVAITPVPLPHRPPGLQTRRPGPCLAGALGRGRSRGKSQANNGPGTSSPRPPPTGVL